MHETDDRRFKEELDAIAKHVDTIMDKINSIYPMKEDTQKDPKIEQA